jgi:predicted NUDIX family NTP pyrophosphohydrolase
MATQNIAAGLLMCRIVDAALQYFLVHPGGPYFKNKDIGVWSIPKGIPNHQEKNLLSIAVREFEEETGIKPNEPYESIGFVQQKAGKIVHAWSFIGDWESVTGIESNTFSMEWPPKSGKIQDFPEMDKGGWFNYSEAKSKINPAQIAFLDRAKQTWIK